MARGNSNLFLNRALVFRRTFSFMQGEAAFVGLGRIRAADLPSPKPTL